jgi:CDP-glucose 4,6-dehydratase
MQSWYANRRVFVSGHTGFKGAWLCLWLQHMGATVVGYALAAKRPSLFEVANVAADMRSIVGDIRDRDNLECALQQSAPEIVIHMAAQSLVRRSYADPVGTFATNVMGTVHVLDCARRVDSVRSVVIVTSDKCYENFGHHRAFQEEDPMGGHDPYSSSKGCAELVTSAFARSFVYPNPAAIASARAGNVIGGGDWGEDRLVPDLMRAVTRGGPDLIRSPDSVRPWQFVLEPLAGYLRLAQRLAEFGEAFVGGWNFGPKDEDMVSVRDLVRRVQIAWPAVEVEYASEATGPHEEPSLKLDSTKAKTLLGWSPVLSLDETVQLTVNWYRAAHEEPSQAAELARAQIRHYEDRCGLAGG